ncbi:glycosyltransferase family 10 domain-containing protein [Polaribacter sp. SA4-12]|uniref:glycosyltransferase family 10 domain-containing protein n=1 Tax=Polaribacter sp. SA4-12 TaxID=1312072 RepID=UPI000B3C544A|nr:glycosyltransferase family 10 [Polaribacter sp. SA4-12]ARV13805.1 hypothetical protein BTO07_01000 [Polaribacter sp. SA4-12]
MKKIAINFTDFWDGFNKKENYFYRLLKTKYDVVISDSPELIIYSCFGNEYLKYNCKRVYYTGENIRPDLTGCDFAFSFDFSNNKRHFRLPLYSLYIEQDRMYDKLKFLKKKDELRRIWEKKNKFVCMVVSNPNAKFRLDFFKELSKYRTVDSGGKVFNNVGGRVACKTEFINSYKFVLAFENSSFDGYTTEKILEPIFTDSIPIYWGNKLIDKDFNPKRFINYNDYGSVEKLYARLVEIENNPDIAIGILSQPIFDMDSNGFENERKKVLNIFSILIESKKRPIAKSYKSYIHFLKVFIRKFKKKVLKLKNN